MGSTPSPQPAGLRFTPPSQSRAPPSPSYFPQQPGYFHDHSPPQQYPYHQQQRPHHPPSPPHPHRSPDMGVEPDTIKCSSCGQGVRMEELGEHVCRPAQQAERSRSANELRVDVQAAGPGWQTREQGYGLGIPLKSPMYAGHLEATPPHTPGSAASNPSRPVSPAADQLSRSTGSASSNGSSRLPFFERYQKQYGAAGGAAAPISGNMAGVGLASMPRSGTMDSFSPPYRSAGSPSPRLAPAGFPYPPARSPTSPLPTSASAPNLNVPAYHRQDSAPPHYPYQQPPRQPSPGPSSKHSYRSDSRDSDFPASTPSSASFTHRRQETPESSVLSTSPPRSRKVSIPGDRGAPLPPPSEPLPPAPAPQQPVRTPSQSSSNSSNILAYDRRETIKPSQSTPADLSSYARRGLPPRKDSIPEGLDACIEDLRLYGEEDDDGGAQAILDEFFEGKKTDSYGHGDGMVDDPLATPRAAGNGQRKMSNSRSTPALAGGLVGRAPLPSSGSVPNLPSSSSSSSRTKPTAERSCTTCSRALPSPRDVQLSGDGQPFCRPCFAERFLPKCRKCRKAIEGGAVTSSDGKVVGKYHRECFACFECGEGFAGGEFYVFDGKPYCQQHYHFLNGSLCANPVCGKPIEGSCVSLVGEENGGGGRYHPSCFNCSEPSCTIPLLEHHFVVDRLPYCEMHSAGPIRRRVPKAGQEDGKSRAKKRMTIITKR
ncbi:hypothetical protein JCM10213_006246 [Rhodosporidiobolus nylandii]